MQLPGGASRRAQRRPAHHLLCKGPGARPPRVRRAVRRRFHCRAMRTRPPRRRRSLPRTVASAPAATNAASIADRPRRPWELCSELRHRRRIASTASTLAPSAHRSRVQLRLRCRCAPARSADPPRCRRPIAPALLRQRAQPPATGRARRDRHRARDLPSVERLRPARRRCGVARVRWKHASPRRPACVRSRLVFAMTCSAPARRRASRPPPSRRQRARGRRPQR